MGISRSAASRHVALLADAGLVERTREGMSVVCHLASAGVRVATSLPDEVALEAGAPGPPEPSARTGLADVDPEDVQLYLAMGASLFRTGGTHPATWRPRMEGLFGTAVRPHLDLLHVATLRIAAGEPLDGLPLPKEVVENGLGPYEDFADPDAAPGLDARTSTPDIGSRAPASTAARRTEPT